MDTSGKIRNQYHRNIEQIFCQNTFLTDFRQIYKTVNTKCLLTTTMHTFVPQPGRNLSCNKHFVLLFVENGITFHPSRRPPKKVLEMKTKPINRARNRKIISFLLSQSVKDYSQILLMHSYDFCVNRCHWRILSGNEKIILRDCPNRLHETPI